ncbi:hypothetical protein PR202_gb04878 [Eleusine coracana subsp. coracana]|uniref:Uncharacterized protein n=1 Tax=Eleusine coracana subsp. coracana TaxID=191504 RepID=A0AAV5E571_ELECO|nr:hypothetical protein PR202_gb04878 [Eleusine coracana subsp. coracana]
MFLHDAQAGPPGLLGLASRRSNCTAADFLTPRRRRSSQRSRRSTCPTWPCQHSLTGWLSHCKSLEVREAQEYLRVEKYLRSKQSGRGCATQDTDMRSVKTLAIQPDKRSVLRSVDVEQWDTASSIQCVENSINKVVFEYFGGEFCQPVGVSHLSAWDG